MNISEVARAAGVSTATVSRTINDASSVRPETAKKVWAAIRKLQYYPNIHARTLVSGRSHMLGLIISDISNPFFPEVTKSFEVVALKHGYEVLLTNTNYDSSRMAGCVRRMLERRVDAVAIMTSEMDDKLIRELTRRGMPMVFLDVGAVGDRISNVRVDYGQGIREAMEHLFGLGHRRIGFISGPSNLRSANTRRTAFLMNLDRYGIPREKQLVQEGNHRIDGGQQAMTRLLGLRNPPTAVLASNDLTAIGALRSVYYNGLRVPYDISIVGFDDIDLSQFMQPPLTTIRLSRTELGEKAFHALYRVLHGESQKGEEYPVETHLVVRQSTGEVPRHR